MNGWGVNNKLNLLLLAISAVSIALYIVFHIPQEVFVLSHILTFGYLHGATDRIIFFADEQHKRFRFQMLFLGVYIAIIATSLLMWSLVPIMMLLLFLAYSAYHFGETHLEQSAMNTRMRKATHFTWGFLVLMGILLVGVEEVIKILDLNQVKIEIQLVRTVGILCFIVNAVLMVFLGVYKKEPGSVFIEVSILATLLIAAIYLPLMVSFTIFFVYWHSFKSFVHQYLYLQKFGGTQLLKKGLKEIVITGVIPLIIGIVAWSFTPFSIEKIDIWKEWIIALAASLSLPHVVLHAYKIYSKKILV